MLEVRGIRIPLSHLDGTQAQEIACVRRALAGRLHIGESELSTFELRRRSIDARKKERINLIFTVRVSLASGRRSEGALVAKLAQKGQDKDVSLVNEVSYTFPGPLSHPPTERPVVVGAGCAGLFCALTLAEAGMAPLLVERGDDVARRSAVVAKHNSTGTLDPDSNIQFGLGGAGAFSDGKLQTGTRGPAHRLILETLVSAGAPDVILMDAHPHIGSDILPAVVENIQRRIEVLGGEVACRTKLVGIDIVNGTIRGATLHVTDPSTGLVRMDHVATNCLVLATGHSARDVFELLLANDVALERKTFAIGVRIEHNQTAINEALYGRAAGHLSLGAAPYKLATHMSDGRGVFTFCMCPGGYVVSAASEPEGVCTNGMSLSDRACTNANAGLLVNVFSNDLKGDSVLAGVDLQRACEQAAFKAGGGAYVAPAQLVGDFLTGRVSTKGASIEPTYPRGVSWGDVGACLPTWVAESLREGIYAFAKRLTGFDAADAVLTGVETRSSSPVRVTRGENGQSVSVVGLWPVGEGAGYAGGIMSAAADGIRAAERIVSSQR